MSASTPATGTPAGHEPAAAPARLTRRWSRALVSGATLTVAAVASVHLAATFLYNAPANPVSQRYAEAVHWWMDPLFSQNWRLFAPNPISENLRIEARASLDPDGRTTGWIDLSAQDEATVRGDPAPGHLAENSLRNAWLQYAQTHDGNGNPTGPNSEIMRQYLLNVVFDRLRGQVGGAIGSVQIRATTTLIPGPGRTAAQSAPQTRTLDWWAAGRGGSTA
ncbi:hypothetical protein KGA66_15965 [Actinocrinis puniceicyclus]|uniref:Uncharacterized protein n=1 Tax=Actinocrinis puniceicyclus TaxID=977794 RepID=A0A8J8BBY7_9ACTN|nr:DUF5819 family protein [Actinocrinis puniceicyclus]MBS2964552.1 hypothetical protein [Actinocrinis puniceicyclus]